MSDALAATRFYRGYRYTVVTIANGAAPHTVEAELWWHRPDEKEAGRWIYFRRSVAASPAEAARLVEADFRAWVEGQLEAADPPA